MSKELKLSKEEFAEFLLRWVAMHLSRKGVKHDAKAIDLMHKGKEMFGLNLSKREEFVKLHLELTAMNLWIVVAVCEGKFKDVEHRNDCLDIFHRRFFDELLTETVEDYEEWLGFLNAKYGEYRGAIERGTDINLMALGELIQSNLHGERYPGALENLQIVIYVGEAMKALRWALAPYEIE